MTITSRLAEKTSLPVAETEPSPKYALWKATGDLKGNWSGALRVSEGEQNVWLPITVNDGNRDQLWFVLNKLGCDMSSAPMVEMPEQQKKKTMLALDIMPPILAFYFGASSNYDANILAKYKDRKVVPVIAPDAKPRSGKTYASILTWLSNDGVVSLWDFDPFSGQSVGVCMQKVQEKIIARGADPKKDVGQLSEILGEVYCENDTGEVRVNTNIKLSTVLDAAMMDYLVNIVGKNVAAILVDVSGYTEETRRWSPFRILGKLLPSINLNCDDNGGIPTKYLSPKGPLRDGYFFIMYDRIAANLGRPPRYQCNGDQYNRAISLAEEDRENWRRIFYDKLKQEKI